MQECPTCRMSVRVHWRQTDDIAGKRDWHTLEKESFAGSFYTFGMKGGLKEDGLKVEKARPRGAKETVSLREVTPRGSKRRRPLALPWWVNVGAQEHGRDLSQTFHREAMALGGTTQWPARRKLWADDSVRSLPATGLVRLIMEPD